VQFEWNTKETELDHSADAIAAMQYVADFFVSEARKSTHQFAMPERLIYMFNPTFTGTDPNQHYPDEQVYYFSNK